MGAEHDVCLGKISAHKPFQHILAQHGLVTVYKHADLKRLFRQGVMFCLILIGGKIDQFEVIGKGDGLVNAFNGSEKMLKPGYLC